MLRLMFYCTAMKLNSCEWNLWQQTVVQVPTHMLLLPLPRENMKIFEPSPLCPIFAFSLFMKLRYHFLCDGYYISCFCLQIGWPSTSSSPLQQTADDTSHFLPSGKGLSPTREMECLKWVKIRRSQHALGSLHFHCTTVQKTPVRCERSVDTAGRPISAGLWSVLDESQCPRPHGHFSWRWGIKMPSCIPLPWRRTLLLQVSLPLKDLKILLCCSFLWNLRT